MLRSRVDHHRHSFKEASRRVAPVNATSSFAGSSELGSRNRRSRKAISLIVRSVAAMPTPSCDPPIEDRAYRPSTLGKLDFTPRSAGYAHVSLSTPEPARACGKRAGADRPRPELAAPDALLSSHWKKRPPAGTAFPCQIERAEVVRSA